MNDYKELIAELKAHCACIIYDDCSKCEGLESEKALCSLSMQLIKRCANAIEQLVGERDAAVKDLHGYCWCCTKVKEHCFPTDDEDCKNWEWRGVQE